MLIQWSRQSEQLQRAKQPAMPNIRPVLLPLNGGPIGTSGMASTYPGSRTDTIYANTFNKYKDQVQLLITVNTEK